jgi:hypothetical protein
LRRTLQEFAAHYHRERNQQGLANELIDRRPAPEVTGAVRRRQRVGGILNFYYRQRRSGRGSERGTERVPSHRRRPMEVETIIDYPETYTTPLRYTQPLELVPDGELIEYVCENPKEVFRQLPPAASE